MGHNERGGSRTRKEEQEKQQRLVRLLFEQVLLFILFADKKAILAPSLAPLYEAINGNVGLVAVYHLGWEAGIERGHKRKRGTRGTRGKRGDA